MNRLQTIYHRHPKATLTTGIAVGVIVLLGGTLGVTSAAAAAADQDAVKTAQGNVRQLNSALDKYNDTKDRYKSEHDLLHGYLAAYQNVLDNTSAGFGQKQVDSAKAAKDELAKSVTVLDHPIPDNSFKSLSVDSKQDNVQINSINRQALKELHKVQNATKSLQGSIDAGTKSAEKANVAALALDGSVKDVKDNTLNANGSADDGSKSAYGSAADNAVRVSSGKFTDADRKQAQSDAGNYTDDTAKAALSVDPQKLNDLYVPLTFARSYEVALANLIQSTANASTDDTSAQDNVINSASATPQQKAQAQQIKQVKQKVQQQKSSTPARGSSSGNSRGGSSNGGSRGNSGGGSTGNSGGNTGGTNNGGGSTHTGGGNNGGGNSGTSPAPGPKPIDHTPHVVVSAGGYSGSCNGSTGSRIGGQTTSSGGTIVISRAPGDVWGYTTYSTSDGWGVAFYVCG